MEKKEIEIDKEQKITLPTTVTNQLNIKNGDLLKYKEIDGDIYLCCND